MPIATTAFDALLRHAEAAPDRVFLNQPRDGQVVPYTFADCVDTSRRLASALRELGMNPGDRVALLSKNCAEWFLADWAMQMAGVVPVPIYSTAGAATIRYVMEHSAARAIVLGPLDDWANQERGLDADIPRIVMPAAPMSGQHAWKDLVDAHGPLDTLHRPGPDDLMSILYTSGSTGTPKGVMVSYGAYQYSCESTIEALELDRDSRLLSYLPLAHITERVVIQGPAVYAGATCSFVESLDTFIDDLKRARPTLFISVPRLWMKFQSGVHEKLPPGRLNLLLKLPIIGKRVAAKIRSGLGLEGARVYGSGTAPIPVDVLEWYGRLGVPISEGWGMTEVTGIGCMNHPFRADWLGTIGTPFPGSEVRISDAGEVLFRGPGLFSGYYRQPELTDESFTDDGFFHTGDKGEWDDALGALRITGRVKDLFKTAKGKYVTPVPIESLLAASDLLEQVCVMGTGLPQPVAVAVLSPAAAAEPAGDVDAALETLLDDINAGLEPHERLSTLFIAREDWSVDNRLLTPTMKIKRDQLEDKYAPLIAGPTDARVVRET